MATGYGFDLPGDFDEDQSSIDRRKLQLIAAMKTPIGGAGSGLIGGIGNFLQNAVGTDLLQGQDARARDLAGQRADFARQALARYAGRDTQAQPEVNPSMPSPELEQAGGGPPIPTNYAPPSEAVGGMVPLPPTYEHKAATPFLPGKLSDKLTDLADVAQGGPLYAKFADKLMTQEAEAPARAEEARLTREAKAELAREGLRARAEEDLRRHEDRLADNQREDRRLEETIRSNQATQEERARAARAQEALRADSLRLQTQIAGERAATRDEKKSDQEKQVVRQTEKYAHQLNAEKIPELDLLLGNVETELKKYEDPKSPTGYKPIPGVGIVGYKKPEVMLDKDELAMRRAVEPLRHLITLSTAGLSQTQSEMQAVLTQDLGLGTGSSDESFIKAIPGLRARLEARKNAIGSGFDPEAVDVYHKRLKDKAPPPAAAPTPAAASAPKLVDTLPMNVPVGTRARDPSNPSKVLKFNGRTWE